MVTDVGYIADVSIYDNLGKWISSSKQSFGSCDELDDPEREYMGGYLSFLVWNQKNNENKFVGSGLYLWNVTYINDDGSRQVKVYKQGIARSENPSENCAFGGY